MKGAVMKRFLLCLFVIFTLSLAIVSLAQEDPEFEDTDFDLADYDFDLSDDDNSDAMRELHGKKGKAKHKQGTPALPLPRPMPIPVVPMQVQQVEVQEVRHEMSCPEGYDLMDNRCVTNELLPGDFVCPPGHQMVDGQCAQFTRGRRDCPEGYRLSGNRCIVTDVVPAELMCEEGELDAAGTGCQLTLEDRVQCPPNFVMGADGQCSQSIPAQKSCPPGYTMHAHGHSCVQETATEAGPVCPSGTTLDMDGKKCFSMKPNKPKCAKGYKMSHDSSKCIKKAKKILAPCPPGFQEFAKHKAVCEKMIEIPPQLTCGQEFNLNPLTGQCEMEFASASTCPPDYHQCTSQPHLCEKMAEQEGVCPPGTSPIGYGPSLRCQASIEHEIIECCPPGFELSYGKCERTEIFAATTGCIGNCDRVRTSMPRHYCPDEYQLVGSRCKREVAHPCPEAAPIPSECEMYIQSHSASLRSAKAEVEQIPANCIPVMVPEICHSDDIIPAEIVCEDDGFFENGVCIYREAIEVEPYCKVGRMDPITGQCVKTTSVPIKTECPDGTTRVGKRCVAFEEHPPMFSCPDGSVSGPNGSCLIRVPALMSAPEVTRSAPLTVCPSGTLQGGMCYDVERIPRQFVCPSGSVPASKHAKDATSMVGGSEIGKYCMIVADFIVTPPHKKYSKPRYYCPDGTPAKGKHCHSHSKAEAIVTCPPGTIERGQLCVRSMAPIAAAGRIRTSLPAPFCPPGTIVQGTRCVSTREAQLLISCPSGYLLQGSECVRFSPMSAICPAGTRQTPEGCIRSRSVAPRVTAVAVDRCATDVCEL